MDRRNFVRAASCVPLAAAGSRFSFASVGTASAGAAETVSKAESAGAMALQQRYELTLRRVLSRDAAPAYTEEFLLADVRPDPVRRFTEYSGDLSGRYIGALSTAARVNGPNSLLARNSLDQLVEKTIALQKHDGYFGKTFHYDKPTDEDLALLWGNGRLLVGLLEYNQLKPSAEVLAACKRLGDWLVRIGPLMLSSEIRAAFGAQHFASSYICWMQQTEGLAGLYAATKDQRYRKLAEDIAAVIERRPSDHVHGYLTSVRGVLDLYHATGDRRFLKQCEAAWDDVAHSQDALITGGVPEGWSPNGHRTEGCAEADWVRLSLALWKATDNAKYLAMAEKAILNEFAFNQFATGDFGHRLYSETGLPGNGSARAWWCCTLHGLRAFPDIQSNVWRAKDGAAYFDLPLDGRVETAEFSAVAHSTLDADGRIKIRIASGGKGPSTLAIRQPEWVSALAIRLNGRLANFAPASGFVRMERKWVAGDVVEVEYPMQLRAEPAGKDRMAFWTGPWLLGAAESDNPNYFNELTEGNRLNANRMRLSGSVGKRGRAFDVAVAAAEIPYESAEYSDPPGTVLLRPIAEQTGQRTTEWELRFLQSTKQS